jgi:hypothetical protein
MNRFDESDPDFVVLECDQCEQPMCVAENGSL